jgi:hypothetical protein
VKFQDPADFREALDSRLEELAGDNEEWLERDRRRVAVGRMLARFAATAPDSWSLSGGFAIDCRSLRPRAAEVVNIEWKASKHKGFLKAPETAAEHDAGDMFEFETEFVSATVDSFGASKRFWVRAVLADELFETFLMNVRMRYAHIGTNPVRADDFLTFAGLDPVDVESLAVEALVAECVYAHTLAVEEEAGPPAAADLLDLKLLSELPEIRGISLALCIFGIFRTYEELMPDSLLHPHDYWAEWYEEAAGSMGVPGDLEDGYNDAAALVDPILNGETFKAIWDPAGKSWHPD